MRFHGSLSRIGIGAGVAAVAVMATLTSGTAGAATAPSNSSPGAAPAVRSHIVPVETPAAVATTPKSNVTYPQTVSVSQAPGDVRKEDGTLVPPPTSDPADLIYASAQDNGSVLRFSAKTVALNNPTTDPIWTQDNTYIGWAIDSAFTNLPQYYVYFQMNTNGTYDGELTYAANDSQVSCTVTLTFDTTNGYQAAVPAACLPNVTSFQWFAYSLYAQYPGFGRSIPDKNTQGGTGFAPPVAAPAPTSPTPGVNPGYWLFARDGGVFAFGASEFHGSLGGQHLNAPIVAAAATLDGKGYWMVASDGGVFAFGDARFYGSMGGTPLNAPIVGIAPVSNGTGYWLIAADGGVFSFGGAQWHGSMGGQHLNKPIVSGTSTSDGAGYWLVASDGGVFSFGDASFKGSMGAVTLNKPIVGMTGSGQGYTLVASDGGVFSFGGAPFFGSTASIALNKPIEGIALSGGGSGYRMVASDGGIFSFGSAPFFGSEGGQPLNQPIVGMASQG